MSRLSGDRCSCGSCPAGRCTTAKPATSQRNATSALRICWHASTGQLLNKPVCVVAVVFSLLQWATVAGAQLGQGSTACVIKQDSCWTDELCRAVVVFSLLHHTTEAGSARAGAARGFMSRHTCDVSMTMLAAAGPAGPGLTIAWPGSPGAPLCTVTPTTDPEPCAPASPGSGLTLRLAQLMRGIQCALMGPSHTLVRAWHMSPSVLQW